QPAKVCLSRAELLAQQTDQLATTRRGDLAPSQEGALGFFDRRPGRGGADRLQPPDLFAGQGRPGDEVAARQGVAAYAEPLQQVSSLGGGRACRRTVLGIR